MSNLYLDPNGKEITYKQWKKRIPSEYVIHEFKTAKTITRLLAADIILDANLIPAERHKRYKMESTNILTHDALGEPYPEPRYVEDEFARQAFPNKERAIEGYVDFLVKWCGGKEAELREVLAREVPVTVAPSIEIRAKDMELKALSARAKPAVMPVTGSPDDDDEEVAEADDGDEFGGDPKVAEPAPTPRAAPGSDKPKTTICDDIGAW